MGDIQDAISGAMNAGLPVLMTIGAFLTISLYNVLELNVIIFTTFKRRSGLYFWSFFIATWGIASHSIGFILKFFSLVSASWVPITLIGIGVISMVTGQSVVLYSRLHLVVHNARKIRWVLYMIIFDAIIFHIPKMVLAYLVSSSNPLPYIRVFSIYDKIQIAVFFAQESIISIVYIYETVRLLHPAKKSKAKQLRHLFIHLIFVNLLILFCDITIFGIQYSGYFDMQTSLKPAVYSLKLKIEFSILNRLIQLVQNKDPTMGNPSSMHSNLDPLEMITSTQSTKFGSFNSAGNAGLMNVDVRELGNDEIMLRARTRELGVQRGDTILWGGEVGTERQRERWNHVFSHEGSLAP